MCCKVCDTAHSVTLHLDVWAQHLANEWLQATEFHDEELVIGCAHDISKVHDRKHA
jgi:hypothetical protein